ncbi:hydrogenase maturation nickel metallochaperone HypA [bacterium]|nr:hydrogenase maturation nickel metallochaperone HypA [bacterium]
MHELSLMLNIIDIIEKEYLKNEDGKIKTIALKVGEFSGVVPEALEFAFEAIKNDSDIYDEANMIIDLVPFKVICKDCNNIFTPDMEYFLQCPKCGSKNTEIQSGRELYIDYIEIDEKE